MSATDTYVAGGEMLPRLLHGLTERDARFVLTLPDVRTVNCQWTGVGSRRKRFRTGERAGERDGETNDNNSLCI